MLEELSPTELESPPDPFLMLTAPVPESEASGLGTREVKDRGITQALLERRAEDLEARIEALKRDLELERERRGAWVDLADHFRPLPVRRPGPDSSGNGTKDAHSFTP